MEVGFDLEKKSLKMRQSENRARYRGFFIFYHIYLGLPGESGFSDHSSGSGFTIKFKSLAHACTGCDIYL